MRMRNILAILFFVAAATLAQAQHKVTLSWTASTDSTSSNPGTVSVYRATGTCPASGIGTLTYTTLTATAPAGGPYADSTVTAGTYCYYVTATISGATSGPSNTVTAVVPTAAPSGLTAVSQ